MNVRWVVVVVEVVSGVNVLCYRDTGILALSQAEIHQRTDIRQVSRRDDDVFNCTACQGHLNVTCYYQDLDLVERNQSLFGPREN